MKSELRRKNFKTLRMLGLLLMLALPARADLTTAVIRGTNGTVSGDGVTINANLRIGTNALTGTTFITNSSPAQSVSNLYSQLTLYSISASLNVAMTNTNTITISGPSLTIALAGNPWAVLTVQTNLGTNHYTLSGPYDSNPITMRTNDANDQVYGIGKYAVTQFPTTAPAFTNYLNKSSASQVVTGKVQFVTGLGGTNLGITNGFVVNAVVTNGSLYATGGLSSDLIITRLITTNLVNRGNAVSSPGTAPGSEQLGTGAMATGTNSFASGHNAAASGSSSTAVGDSSAASGYLSGAWGWGSAAQGYASIAIGAARAGGSNSIVIGNGGDANGYDNCVVIAPWNGSGTDTNQIKLGREGGADRVRIPGQLTAGSITNQTYTGTNLWQGDVSFVPGTYSSMANTNNVIPAMTNTTIYLSGASSLHNVIGHSGGRAGLRQRFRDGSGAYNVIINNLSGGAAAADRILTGTGGDITLTNQPCWFELEYNASSSQWELIRLGN